MVRKQCRKCKWHGVLSGYANHKAYFCAYSQYHDRPAMQRADNGSLIDTRGRDHYDCLLFECGDPETRQLSKTKIYRKTQGRREGER